MRWATLSAVVMSMLVCGGCSDAHLAAVTATAQNARGGNVVRVVTTAAVAQMAVLHIAAALSEAARRDFSSGDVPSLASNAGSEYAYQVDTSAGRGTVTRTSAGKRTVDLAFTFVSEASNAGKAYAITSTTGTFEGYQMVFPRLTVAFTAVLGEQLVPTRHENGSPLMNVEIRAVGTLGANGNEAARISDLSLGLTYPALPGTRTVGALRATGTDGTAMSGAVIEQEGALRIAGGVTTPGGGPTYKVDTGANGELSLSEEAAPREAAGLNAAGAPPAASPPLAPPG